MLRGVVSTPALGLKTLGTLPERVGAAKRNFRLFQAVDDAVHKLWK
jgi:hypothetical protein